MSCKSPLSSDEDVVDATLKELDRLFLRKMTQRVVTCLWRSPCAVMRTLWMRR